jgi:hypothetical protein
VKPKKGVGTTVRKPLSTEKENGLSKELSEKSGSEEVLRGSRATVHQKLLALVQGKKVEDTMKEGKGKATSNVRPTKKECACDAPQGVRRKTPP